MLPKHLNGTVECFVGNEAFWTSWGALRKISYHCVRNSLHCIYEYRTLAYVTLQDRKYGRRPCNIRSHSSPAPPPGSVMRQPACLPERATARSSSPGAA